MGTPQFELLPEDRRLTPDDALAAATAGALTISDPVTPVQEPAPLPLGRTWQFDFEEGRFVRAGSSPAETRGQGAVAQWCLMTVYSARFANAVFTSQFGMDEPESPLGEFAVGEVLADYRRNLIDALLVHDRISSVESIDMLWDPTTGTLFIRSFDVITDAGDSFTIDGTIGGSP